MITIIVILWLILLIGTPLLAAWILWETSGPSDKVVTRLRKAGF